MFNLHDTYQDCNPGVKQDLPVYVESEIRVSDSGLFVCDTM